jgi:hypothetical protein
MFLNMNSITQIPPRVARKRVRAILCKLVAREYHAKHPEVVAGNRQRQRVLDQDAS